MDKQDVISELRSLQGSDDTEVAHCEADDLLCELLISLGYQDVVDEYYKVPKWYA